MKCGLGFNSFRNLHSVSDFPTIDMPLRYLFLISLLIPMEVRSQSGYFEHSPVWVVHSDCVYSDPSCHQVENYSYWIGGDTSVAGRQYKKLMKFGYGSYSWWGTPPPPPGCSGSYTVGSYNVPFALLRDSARKIFKYGTPEELVHDFNLRLGDTLSQVCYGAQHYWVQLIDTLSVGQDVLERFHLAGAGVLSTLMEGIGHDFGLLEYIDPIDCVTFLICYQRDDTAYFPTKGPACQLPVSIPENIREADLVTTIQDGRLCLANHKHEPLTIRLFDLEGRCLIDKHQLTNECWELGILPGNFYVLEVSSQEGRHWRKLILNNY